MTSNVLITRHPDNHYTARALALPDVVASGTTEQEAVDKLRESLTALRAHSRVVQVDLPLPQVPEDNPWLRAAGIWAQDPDWDVFADAVTMYRQQIDAQFQPE